MSMGLLMVVGGGEVGGGGDLTSSQLDTRPRSNTMAQRISCRVAFNGGHHANNTRESFRPFAFVYMSALLLTPLPTHSCIACFRV